MIIITLLNVHGFTDETRVGDVHGHDTGEFVGLCQSGNYSGLGVVFEPDQVNVGIVEVVHTSEFEIIDLCIEFHDVTLVDKSVNVNNRVHIGLHENTKGDTVTTTTTKAF